MKSLEIPQFPVLREEDAIWALSSFINELEEQRDKELTDKQRTALKKFAQGLMSSIAAEMKSKSLDENLREKRFVPRLKRQLQDTFLNTLPFRT